jgi:uncharacterized SAM-binding protein YcdF (DUF218 family)
MDSTHIKWKKSTGRPLRVLSWILGGLTLLGISAGLVILLGVGRWLVRENPLEQATAIAVLSGNTPARALEAARLYHDGYAKEIWLTHPGTNVDALKVLGIDYPAEDDVNTRVLRGQGVPAKAIHVLDTSIVNTSDELDTISATLKAKGGHKVIVVTNKAHTRRVHILWNKYIGSRGEVITHGVSDDDFEPARWWRTSGSLTQVTHEVLGIMNAWAGMPVQPIPHPPTAVVAARVR